MKLIKRIAFGSAGLLATFLEKIQGTDTAWSVIYGSPVFTTIWGIMTICAFAYLIHRKLQREFFTFLLHTAFLIILTGALTTRLCGKQGSIHLRMNDAPASAFITSGQNKEPLPFQVQLHDFRIDYYKGSFAPMDFTSRIRIDDNGTQTEGEVSMNRIFTYRHYRFYQSAYDKDGRGTTLAVSYDPCSSFKKTACSAGFSPILRYIIKPRYYALPYLHSSPAWHPKPPNTYRAKRLPK